MTIRFLTSWKGYQPGDIATLAGEDALIAGGIARLSSTVDGPEFGMPPSPEDAVGAETVSAAQAAAIAAAAGNGLIFGGYLLDSIRYSTLAAAGTAALALQHFVETALAGTIAVTQYSTAITGSGTAFLTALKYATHVSITTGGTRRWYRLSGQIIDDTHAILEVPYMEATGSGVSAVSGVEKLHTILALEDSTTTVTIGTGAENANIAIDFQGHQAGSININLSSGTAIVRAGNNMVNLGLGVGVGDARVEQIFNSINPSSAPDDWFTGASGRMFVKACNLSGNFDILLPGVKSKLIVEDSILYSRNINQVAGTTNETFGALFALDKATAVFRNNQIKVSASGGSTIGAYVSGLVEATGSPTANNVVKFEHNEFVFIKEPGTTEVTTLWGMAFGITDSDIYLDNNVFRYEGNPTPQAAWRMFTNDATIIGATANRVWINNTKLLDLQSTTTQGPISELTGPRGKKALTFNATLPATELSALRGSTFTLTLTAAVTTIGSVSNAPDGTEIMFIFTQDGTGGHGISGWNSAYVFATAWSDTGNTLGKVSTVSFRKSGTKWYQISPANAWL